MSNQSPINLLALMSIISKLEMESHNINVNKIRGARTREPFSKPHVSKIVPKVIGKPRRYANLTGNARTKMRI